MCPGAIGHIVDEISLDEREDDKTEKSDKDDMAAQIPIRDDDNDSDGLTSPRVKEEDSSAADPTKTLPKKCPKLIDL